MGVTKNGATRKKMNRNQHILRFHPADTTWEMIAATCLGYTLLFAPFLHAADRIYVVVYFLIVTMLSVIAIFERFRPHIFLHFIAALPRYLLGPILYMSAFLSIISTGKATPTIAAVAIISGFGIVSTTCIEIRRMSVDACVNAAKHMSILTLTPRGVAINPPWSAGSFLPLRVWEKRYIMGFSVVLVIIWVVGACMQAPYMYTSVGIKERWPIVFALTAFPAAFFFSRLWQMPFMLYCQKNPESLLESAKLADAKMRREAEREQKALDKEEKRLERQRDREERRRANART